MIAPNRLQALFGSALELEHHARAPFLDRECGDDVDLRRKVQALLDSDAKLAGMTAKPLGLGLQQLLAATAPGSSLVGLRIGPFELRDEIGRGGMGLVYRAQRVDGAVEQQVAIKLVRRELLDSNTLKRFQLERRILASLDHPNIARLLDASELADGTPHYVMEYVPGASITEHCDRVGASVRERVALIRTVCGAVAHAHRNLIVHRDLKPSNVHVTSAGVPKLLDFGIAKPLVVAHEATRTAERFFSPLYAAPEQMLGKPVSVGCDVYALGLMLFELLAGRRAFELEGITAAQVERLICEVPPPAPSTVAADPARARALRGDLDDIVLKCLRKSPAERYSSVEQLEADLGNYLDGRPVAARGGHAWYRARKFVGRHRLSVGIASAAVLALGVAAAALVERTIALAQERDRASYALTFLTDAFAAADPSRASGPDVTARRILEGAQTKVDELFDSKPELYASLAGTLADVELSIGMTRPAAELAGRASDAAQRARLDPESLRRLLILRGKSLAVAHKFGESEQALAEAERLGAGGTPEWLLAKGRLLALKGKPNDALAHLRKALALVADRPPTQQLPTSVRWDLAEAFQMAGDDAAARAIADETLRWQETLPKGHPLTLMTRLRRVPILRKLNDPSALGEAQAVVDDVDRVYGAHSGFSAFAHDSLAVVLESAGRREEAIAQYRSALAAWRESEGIDHANALRTMSSLAKALSSDPKSRSEAGEIFRTALELASRRLGGGDATVLSFREQYGKFLLEAGRPAEAVDVLATPESLEALALPAATGDGSDYADLIQRASATGCASASTNAASCRRARTWLDLAAKSATPRT